MFSDIARAIAGPVVERILVSAARARGELPRPHGEPHVHAMGPDPDRILLIGAGIVRGLGVASHDLGLGGHLARRLSELTGRGADVELIGVHSLTVPAATRLLAAVELERFDSVVLMLGAREAIGLKSPQRWERDIRALLAQVRENSLPGLTVFMIAIAPLPTVIPLGWVLAPVVGGHIERLNAAMERACSVSGAHFIRFGPQAVADFSGLADTSTYAAWSVPVALGMYAALDDSVPVPHTRRVDEQLRQDALDAMGILDSPPTAELDALARVAKDLFGVAGAAVNFIDHDRQYMKAASGIERADRPRNESLCSVTVGTSGALISEDTRLDARFEGFTAVAEGILFYAGYPIEAPGGQRVGTLCIFDTKPRAFSGADQSLLRQLALRVQSELWSHLTSV